MLPVKFVKVHPNARPPEYKTEGSAGMDLYAVEKICLYSEDLPVAVNTGLKIQLPPGYEAQIRSRSSLALVGVTVANSPGTLDCDFTGVVKVLLTYYDAGRALGEFEIRPGDRIAQMVIAKYERAEFVEVEALEETTRGEGGFGSTGK